MAQDKQQIIEFVLKKEMSGKRLDSVIPLEIKDISRSFVQKLFDNKKI